MRSKSVLTSTLTGASSLRPQWESDGTTSRHIPTAEVLQKPCHRKPFVVSAGFQQPLTPVVINAYTARL